MSFSLRALHTNPTVTVTSGTVFISHSGNFRRVQKKMSIPPNPQQPQQRDKETARSGVRSSRGAPRARARATRERRRLWADPAPPPLVNHGYHPLAEEGFPTIRCGRGRLSNLEEEVEEVQEEQRQPTWSRRRKPESSPPETEGGVAGLGECGNCGGCGATDQR